MDRNRIINELQFKAVRSSGAGGQHVNKVSTKIELSFNVLSSIALSDPEKERLLLKLKKRLTKEHVLLLQCDESRSQHKNKELIIKRFLELLKDALSIPKKRKRTKPSRAAIEKRLKDKKVSSEKKANRSKRDFD